MRRSTNVLAAEVENAQRKEMYIDPITLHWNKEFLGHFILK